MAQCPTPKKRAYDHHSEAVTAWKAMLAKGHTTDLRPYKCVCGKHHVGKSPGLLTRRIKKAIGNTRKRRPRRRP